ncbi:IQ domain-containing protein K-like [Diorhabda carinulata]|uniref:IQ domain-containing protein K-like n=1 Tax=Diorhabda carinulata TaxID=1163345 RepID=UPI0025A1EB25|nr:IQ domain-containing protein K-like [Diorhabda carinulata]
MAQAQLRTAVASMSVSNAPTEIDAYDDEEIDPDIAAEIMEDWDTNKALVEAHKKSKQNICETETNPALVQVEKLIYPTLQNFLIKLLHKAIENDCCFKPKTSFNGIDFLSECLYNSNPKYPGRSNPWKGVFDLNWVVEYLQIKPRPYFPLSCLMSRSTAVRYIQAHLRGYWVRRRADLQEIRSFWKNIKFNRDSETNASMVAMSESSKKPSQSNVDENEAK